MGGARAQVEAVRQRGNRLMTVTYRSDLDGVDWEALKQDLIADDFHNGRTTAQVRTSFENSGAVAMGFEGDRCIANGRLLSDGVGNAYVIDVWTKSAYRRQGIARTIMHMLISTVPGQHIYLQTDDASGFYEKLGFVEQPKGMMFIAGRYLNRRAGTTSTGA
jgi:ribosomal protein S18 acetylase RimI-like enzyme